MHRSGKPKGVKLQGFESLILLQYFKKMVKKLIFETNKDKGRTGLALAIGYFGSHGYTVSIPLNDTQDYDLLVDDGNQILKISVKATAQIASSGASIVSLRNTGGTKGTVYGREVDKNIDFVFVVNNKSEMWLLPKMILTTNSMSLGEKYNQYKLEL